MSPQREDESSESSTADGDDDASADIEQPGTGAETDRSGTTGLSRRSALAALGLTGLLGLGATSASADPQGQIGTDADPLRELHTQTIRSPGALTITTTGANGNAGPIVAGHENNETTDDRSTVIAGGGTASNPNRTTGKRATIGGGFNNVAGDSATVAGGYSNTASGNVATIAGGDNNAASLYGATIAGGESNESSGYVSAVGGGIANVASVDYATVSGGSDNEARGMYSTVPGGFENRATGMGAFAAGNMAVADSYATFVWNDKSQWSSQSDFRSSEAVSGEPVTGDYTFNVSASGGVRFVTGANTVTYIESGTAGWSNTSTRTAKTNVEPIDPEAALEGVESLAVARWEYRDADTAGTGDEGDGVATPDGTGSARIGPFAEEFHDAFDVGGSDEHINSIDADGVALAAIQGLAKRLEDHKADLATERRRNDEHETRIEDLESENDALRDRLTAVENRLDAAPTEEQR